MLDCLTFSPIVLLLIALPLTGFANTQQTNPLPQPLAWSKLIHKPEPVNNQDTNSNKQTNSAASIPQLPDLGMMKHETLSWLNVNQDRPPPMLNMSLEGRYIQIPGYMLKNSPTVINASKEKGFWLVPHFGTGILSPPPAHDQMIYVTYPKTNQKKLNTTPPPEDQKLTVIGKLHIITGNKTNSSGAHWTYQLQAERIIY